MLDFTYSLLEIAPWWIFFKLCLPRLCARGRGCRGCCTTGVLVCLRGLGFGNISQHNVQTPFESVTVQTLISTQLCSFLFYDDTVFP